jgi:hypothetical protein
MIKLFEDSPYRETDCVLMSDVVIMAAVTDSRLDVNNGGQTSSRYHAQNDTLQVSALPLNATRRNEGSEIRRRNYSTLLTLGVREKTQLSLFSLCTSTTRRK